MYEDFTDVLVTSSAIAPIGGASYLTMSRRYPDHVTAHGTSQTSGYPYKIFRLDNTYNIILTSQTTDDYTVPIEYGLQVPPQDIAEMRNTVLFLENSGSPAKLKTIIWEELNGTIVMDSLSILDEEVVGSMEIVNGGVAGLVLLDTYANPGGMGYKRRRYPLSGFTSGIYGSVNDLLDQGYGEIDCAGYYERHKCDESYTYCAINTGTKIWKIFPQFSDIILTSLDYPNTVCALLIDGYYDPLVIVPGREPTTLSIGVGSTFSIIQSIEAPVLRWRTSNEIVFDATAVAYNSVIRVSLSDLMVLDDELTHYLLTMQRVYDTINIIGLCNTPLYSFSLNELIILSDLVNGVNHHYYLSDYMETIDTLIINFKDIEILETVTLQQAVSKYGSEYSKSLENIVTLLEEASRWYLVEDDFTLEEHADMAPYENSIAFSDSVSYDVIKRVDTEVFTMSSSAIAHVTGGRLINSYIGLTARAVGYKRVV